MNKESIKTVNVLGVPISAVTLEQAVNTMEEWIKQRDQHYICVAPAYSVALCQTDPTIKQIFNNAGMVTPDGMGLVWAMRVLGYSQKERIYGPDLMLKFSEVAAKKGYTNFYYGGGPGIAEKLAQEMKERFRGLEIVGTFTPPFRPLTPKEDKIVTEMINKAKPDVVWIGISTPKQDLWMAEHIGKINVPVMVGVGAAFNFLSGKVKQAPKWMQRSGLEWLFRLYQEPGRLWYRYLVYNPLFVLNLALQWSGLRKFKG